MDHRASSRQSLNLGVQVNWHGHCYSGHTRDVCLGGLFVSMEDSNLRKGTSVDLLFKVTQQDAHERNYQIRAKVVRMEEHGAGMSFAAPDITAFRALQELMHLSWSENSVTSAH